MSKKAIIIGSGIAGIASAIRLQLQGYAVEIYEKNDYFGGKLGSVEGKSYRFDAGPSLFTMPHFVEELFELAGKKPSDYFTYQRSKTSCHYFFEDGTFLPFSSNPEETYKTVEKELNISSSPLKARFKKAAFQYEKTHKTFLEMSLHRWSNYFSKSVFESIRAIPKLELFTTMNKANEKALNHPKLVQIFNRFATYNGSNPYEAPGILNVIPHLEHGFGTFFPTKGMRSIPESLMQLALDLGVQIHLNQEVRHIHTEGDQVKGIETDQGFIPADVVFCNSDVRPTYKHLLPQLPFPSTIFQQEPSSSALIFYWGIKKRFPKLDLHNIFFSDHYKEEFDAIFDQQTILHDPTVYVHISSKMKPDDAPENCENWFVMINVPANSGQDWEELKTFARERIIAKLNRILQTDLETLIDFEEMLDPILIEQRTSSYAGALYGSSSNDRMAAFFRHPNFSKIRGLYFVGGSVHPGGGIPLCLLSAKIAVNDLSQNG